MSQLMTELFYGRPRPAWGVGDSFRHGPRYYYDDEVVPYNSRRDFGPYSKGPIMPDVVLQVPMDSMEAEEIVKEALNVQGVYNVISDLQAETVTVSSSLAPRVVLQLVRRVSRNAEILTYKNYNTSSYNSPYSMAPSEYGPYSRYSPSYSRSYYDDYHRPHYTNYTYY